METAKQFLGRPHISTFNFQGPMAFYLVSVETSPLVPHKLKSFTLVLLIFS